MKVEEVKPTDPEAVSDSQVAVVSSFDPKLPIYMVDFRRGNRPVERKYFQLQGDLRKAIDKSRNWCQKMDYRFCGTFAFLIDLDKELELHMNGSTS